MYLIQAAQRGDEPVPSLTQVDTRLSFLALVETLVRYGTEHWECGQYVTAAAERILKDIIVPNLVWRAGRVEGTLRKVAIAIAHNVLKAGAVQSTTLFQSATDLVPLLVSHLDDQDLSTRLIACYCLTILFDRLKGAFSEQAIHELYPKLLKRLDDSNDQMRITICSTLVSFFNNAPSKCYTGTLYDYTLDQLFIHLDDPDSEIQQAVYNTIINISYINKDLVLKKATLHKSTHRDPKYCMNIINEIQGYEVLDDDGA